jgi:hypothetical protein
MNFFAIKAAFAILLLASIFSSVAYACSSEGCDHEDVCPDVCMDGYWYSGGQKAVDCSESIQCQFSNKVCADSDANDDYPKVGCEVKTCSAECDQNSDCVCPTNGCVGKDYHDYVNNGCSDSCKCVCQDNIINNDPRCTLCDVGNVDCTNTACYENPICTACDAGNLDCNNPACLSSPLCLPCDVNNVNCSIQACSSNVLCLPCDANNVNCSIPACSVNSLCVQPTPSPQGGGGGAIINGGGGGYYPTIPRPIVCGNSVCENMENCSGCPKDCLNASEICCNGISYAGECCFDGDCQKGYECSVGKKCLKSSGNVNQTIQVQSCQANWGCVDWSDCGNDIQTRKCVDKNDCNNITDTPDFFRRCVQTLPTGLFLTSGTLEAVVLLLGIAILVLLFIWSRRRKAKSVPE